MRARLKITAMALAALFALGAVGASAAQAASLVDVGAAPAWITGEQIAGAPLRLILKKETGSASLGTLKCTVARLEATPNAANEATFTPSYAECTFGGLKAEVKVNGCRYTLTSTPVARIWNFDIAQCTKPLEIVSAGTCVITIPNQGPLADIELKNIALTNPTHVEANFTVSMITWEGHAGCPAVFAGVHGTNAELIAPTTVKAFEDVGGGLEKNQVKLEAT